MSENSNDKPLYYWRKNRYSNSDVDKLSVQLDHILGVRVEFIADEMPICTFSRRIAESGEGHFPAVLGFLSDAMKLQPQSGWQGSFFMWLEDGMWETYHQLSRQAPLMAFGRHLSDSMTFLIPDPAFMNSKGYQSELNELHAVESNLSWDSKIPTAFWRGGSSGLGITTARWREASRVCLVTESKAINQPERVDAYISKVDLSTDMPGYAGLYQEGLIGNYVPLIDFFKYRYLIDVDGNCTSWIASFLKLSSQSLVIKAWSPYEQWYYNLIKAWEHFVPIRANCSDLKYSLDWIDTHQEQCKEISRNAQMVMQQITYERTLHEFAELVSQVLACNRAN